MKILLFLSRTGMIEVIVRTNAAGGEPSLNSPEYFHEMQTFIESQRPENTKKKTTYDINVIKRSFKVELLSLKYLCKLLWTPLREDGLYSSPFFLRASMKNFASRIFSSLSGKFSISLVSFIVLNILQDQEFSKSREVLLAKKRELATQNAKGNRSQDSHDLTMAEENRLFVLGLFGKQEPEVLKRTV